MGGRFSSSLNKSAKGDDSGAEDTLVVQQHKNNNNAMSHRCGVVRLPILETLSFWNGSFEMSVPKPHLDCQSLSTFLPGSLEVRQK
jgi:hypothetical protein